jgi:DNA replication and repair protein RecF
MLPLQLINPDSFRLLEGAPKVRRQFLDWGVFHVEPRFMATWQRLQKALRQRNSWLRHGTLDAVSQAAWDRELCQASAEIDEYRRNYIKALKPVFEQNLERTGRARRVDAELLPRLGQGPGTQRSPRYLSSADQQMGHTQAGPQRADLRLRLGANNAADILSRGQQKLVVCALRIAQGHLVSQARRGQCIYLVDDLPSELDEQHRRALCRLLEELTARCSSPV